MHSTCPRFPEFCIGAVLGLNPIKAIASSQLNRLFCCSWDYNSFAQPDVGPEDEEAYARRMWEDMQKKSHTQSQATPATAEAWGQADSAQGRRRKAAEEASERSRKILEEEQAKDRAWRQAVLQVSLSGSCMESFPSTICSHAAHMNGGNLGHAYCHVAQLLMHFHFHYVQDFCYLVRETIKIRASASQS